MKIRTSTSSSRTRRRSTGTRTGWANFLRKPPFDPFTLLRVPYLGRLLAVRRRLLEDCTEGGPVFRHEYEGIEEHDLWLRLALTGRVVSRAHSTLRLLSSGRLRVSGLVEPLLDPGETPSPARRARAASLSRSGLDREGARDRDPLASSSVWITDLRGQPAPSLLVVIPFKDQIETTIKCLESIERQEHRLDVCRAWSTTDRSSPGLCPDCGTGRLAPGWPGTRFSITMERSTSPG